MIGLIQFTGLVLPYCPNGISKKHNIESHISLGALELTGRWLIKSWTKIQRVDRKRATEDAIFP